MPLGYEQLKEDFEAAAAEKEKAEAQQAEKVAADKPVPSETSLGDEDAAA